MSKTLGLRTIPLVERPDTSLVQISEALCIIPSCIQPKYRRADMLVCKAYDALANVSSIAETIQLAIGP